MLIKGIHYSFFFSKIKDLEDVKLKGCTMDDPIKELRRRLNND